ncbi:methyltransferase-like protein 24 [Amphibalanus amphitrite]|uniref:methyltransferase-like protein 24 n=1 Tax=Amphibalanus amphitrite TaxID=1232801 RepID=UPI001C91EE6A|nr:methyltransferase-like protein 24 [Amphibalanus amphitrite]
MTGTTPLRRGPLKVAVGAAMLVTFMLLVAQHSWHHPPEESLTPAVQLPELSPNAESMVKPPALPPAPDDDTAMTVALFRYIENPEACCRKLTMFGGTLAGGKKIDGDKFVCLDAEHAPPPGACLVYSVGISNEWSFDRQMTSYGCELHCFDPSMKSYNRNVTEFGARFYKIGLSGRTEVRPNGWHMMTLTDIRQKLGHSERDIHYLKVDIEGSEWSWLENDPQSLRGVHQLGMEVHMTLKPASLRRHYAVFRAIQQEGFALVHVNANRVYGRQSKLPGVQDKVSSLYELVWVRVK